MNQETKVQTTSLVNVPDISSFEASISAFRLEIDLLIDGHSEIAAYQEPDKDQLKEVRSSYTVVRRYRIDKVKEIKEIKKSLTELAKSIGALCSNEIERVKTLEQHLKGIIDTQKELVKKQKQEEEQKAQQEFIRRTDLLFANGFAFDGQCYSKNGIMLTPEAIGTLPETQFHSYLIDAIQEIPEKEIDEQKEQANQTIEENSIQGLFEPGKSAVIPQVEEEVQKSKQEHVEAAQRMFGEAKSINELSSDYIMGFDKCRGMIIQMLESGEINRRSEMITFIQNLKYKQDG